MNDLIGRSDGLVNYVGIYMTHTQNAVLVFIDAGPAEVWIPLSKLVDWRVLGDDTPGLRFQDLDKEEDMIQVTIPQWLARREGLPV